jgi:hypothetical protein
MEHKSYHGPERRDSSERVADLEVIAKKAAHEAITEVLELFGVDASTQDGRKRFRDNLDWLDGLRADTGAVKKKIVGVGISTVVIALLGILLKAIFGSHLPPIVGDGG